jgi:plasmid stability protein
METMQTKPTQLHLTEGLRAKLQTQATRERRSMSSLAEELLVQALEERASPNDRIERVLNAGR